MNNNDILIRLRYALDIKDTEVVEIFRLGGVDISKEDVLKMLQKPKDNKNNGTDNTDNDDNDRNKDDFKDNLKCNNFMLESFLNGFIIFKRGKQEEKPDQPSRPVLSIRDSKSVNNVLLKKVKIALELSSEDMLDILESAGVSITKGELSAVFRKEGHKNYKECGDRYARNFLRGLATKYRK